MKSAGFRNRNTGTFAFALSTLVSVVAGCGRGPGSAEPPPPEVPVITLAASDVPIYEEWVGQTQGAADIEIRARVVGVIEAIHFEEGTRVQEGALLYSIDPSELQQRMAAAQAQLAQAQTLYADAASNLARYKPLAAINAVSQRDLEEAVAREGATRNQVKAAEAGLRVAEINLGYASVRAPISGHIGISKVKVGDLVSPIGNSLLNTISAIDEIHVRFSISEREYLDYSRRFGAEVRPRDDPRGVPLKLLLADASEHPHSGRVISIDRGVDPTTGTLTVEAAFPNPEGMLRPGLFARVRAVTENRSNALLVPQRAIRDLQGQFQAFVVGADDKVEVRGIQVGPRIGNEWVVEKGLKPGDRLILAGTQRLKPGTRVVPTAPEPAQPPAGGAAPQK
jgi:membrane fusion protein (multidrug efflux system)